MAKNGVEVAIEILRNEIADRQRAIDALIVAAGPQVEETPPKKRGRKRKAGLPAQQNETSADGF